MQRQAVISAGNGDAQDSSVLMLHGGPGYYWLKQEIETLASLTPKKARFLAVQARGCGLGDFVSRNDDLLDDNLFKRAEDLRHFDAPDILLGHSTGAMVALTAVMEGFVKPKKILLVSPYTAALGEHHYWVTAKAALYPQNFARFYGFVAENWQTYKGALPADFKENLYLHWGELFFALPNDAEKLRAKLLYLSFHVIDAVPWAGNFDDGEPFTHYKNLLAHADDIGGQLKDDLLRIATITAHWWRTNFQDGYDFIGKLQNASFEVPIHILSGKRDEITPPLTVNRLAEMLNVTPEITPNGHHLPESAMPGTLQKDLAEYLGRLL